MAELIRNNKINDSFIKDNTSNFEQIKEFLLKQELDEAVSITGVSSEIIKNIVSIISDPSKNIVAYYNMDSRIDRSSGDLKSPCYTYDAFR